MPTSGEVLHGDALMSGRLTRRAMTGILVVTIVVSPIEALSTDAPLVLWTLPVRILALVANLWALRTRRLEPIGAGRVYLAQAALTVAGWSWLLGDSPSRLAFQCTSHGSVLSILALLVAPRRQRRWWSVAVVVVVMIPAAFQLLPQDALLFSQSATILVLHALALATLDVHANQVETESRMASIDPLTGLFNRRPTLIRLTEQVGVATDDRSTSSVLVIDLDHFKMLNDTLGHEAGDEALRGVAVALTALMGRDDVVCRWGGEEFLVLLPGADEQTAAQTAAACAASIVHLGVTASIGVAEVRCDDTVASWVARADRAMYAAKQGGRNQVITASPAINDLDSV